MDFNLQNYSSDHYKIQSESRRAKLVRDLTYSDFATSFGISDVLNSSDAQTGVISDMYII